jgi:hypothetical protein
VGGGERRDGVAFYYYSLGRILRTHNWQIIFRLAETNLAL